MNREIKKKWKAFAVNEMLAIYAGSFEPDEIFDLLVRADKDTLGGVVEKARVQFQFDDNRYLRPVDFVWRMHALAANAQKVEESNE